MKREKIHIERLRKRGIFIVAVVDVDLLTDVATVVTAASCCVVVRVCEREKERKRCC